MNLRYFVMTGLALFGLFQQATAAEPSTCMGDQHYTEWTQIYFASADAVFLGKVVFEETPDRCTPPIKPGSDPDNVNTMDELLENIQAGQAAYAQYCGSAPARLQKATFEVDKSWKGSVGSTITVKAKLNSNDTGDHPILRRGDSYLVFAYKNDNDTTLRVPVGCASHPLVKDTVSKIRVLDALTKKPETR